jgi:hypothetical protein
VDEGTSGLHHWIIRITSDHRSEITITGSKEQVAIVPPLIHEADIHIEDSCEREGIREGSREAKAWTSAGIPRGSPRQEGEGEDMRWAIAAAGERVLLSVMLGCWVWGRLCLLGSNSIPRLVTRSASFMLV